MTKQKNKKRKKYIDNEKFHNELKIYLDECDIIWQQYLKEHKRKTQDSLQRGEEPLPLKKKNDASIPWPIIPDYIGTCFYKIAEKLNNCGNFAGYSFRDEMVADGIYDCIKNIRSFNPSNENANAFSYFTQACYFASVRRIKKEAKQTEIKGKMILNSGILSNFDVNTQKHDESLHNDGYLDFLFENFGTDGEKTKTKNTIKKTTKAHQKRMKEKQQKLNEDSTDK